MTDENPPNATPDASLVKAYEQLRNERLELTAGQLAALDAVARARQRDEITARDAEEIEEVIRAGRVAGARKRLTRARRTHRR